MKHLLKLLLLFFASNVCFASMHNIDSTFKTEAELMQELEVELHTLIIWECSDQNPSKGKFDLRCEIMVTDKNQSR